MRAASRNKIKEILKRKRAAICRPSCVITLSFVFVDSKPNVWQSGSKATTDILNNYSRSATLCKTTCSVSWTFRHVAEGKTKNINFKFINLISVFSVSILFLFGCVSTSDARIHLSMINFFSNGNKISQRCKKRKTIENNLQDF